MNTNSKTCLWALSLALIASGASAQGAGGSTEGTPTDAPSRQEAVDGGGSTGTGATTPDSGTTRREPTDVHASTTPATGTPGTGTTAPAPTAPGDDVDNPRPISPMNPESTPGGDRSPGSDTTPE